MTAVVECCCWVSGVDMVLVLVDVHIKMFSDGECCVGTQCMHAVHAGELTKIPCLRQPSNIQAIPSHIPHISKFIRRRNSLIVLLMHQDQAIPWQTVAAHLIYIHENPHLTPRRSDLFSRRLPTQTKSLHYFVRALASTIHSFSATERAKYLERLALRDSGKLYPDELLSSAAGVAGSDAYSLKPLNSENQVIEFWIDRAEVNGGHYNTSNGDLADATKALFAANEMGPLLMLAQHPKVPLGDLRRLSWGHSFGFNYVATTALTAYIFFNVLEATPAAQKCRQL